MVPALDCEAGHRMTRSWDAVPFKADPADPAPNTDINHVVPAGYEWRVYRVAFTLSAAGATTCHFEVGHHMSAPRTLTGWSAGWFAGQTNTFVVGVGTPLSDAFMQAYRQAPLPPRFVLPAGEAIKTFRSTSTAGDQWSVKWLLKERKV
jgi:hypothetical protein